MCAVKARIPKEKLASVATGSGRHTSVHSNEKPELSRTKRLREENEMVGKEVGGWRWQRWGEDVDKKTERSGSFVYNEQSECEGC